MKSATGSYWSTSPARLVRRPADEVTAAACSRRTITSRTGRSPTLSIDPVTVTIGLAGGGHHLGGDAVDAHLQERHRPRLARRGVGDSRGQRRRAISSAARRAGETAPRQHRRRSVTALVRSRSSAAEMCWFVGTTVAGVRVRLGAPPRRGARQRRQCGGPVGVQLVDQLAGDLGESAFVGVGQPGRQLLSGTQATSLTSTSSSESSPPRNRIR